MRVFLSYARQDRSAVDGLVSDVERLGHDVWYDDDLSGGQAWWNEIIRQVRSCDVLVFVLSEHSSRSEACKLEAGYATELARPIVPVRIDPSVSPRLLPAFLVERQFVDYASRDADAAFALARAFGAVEPAVPLPDPLPDPPPVPFSYLTGLAARVAAPQVMAPEEQWAAMAELRTRLLDDEQRTDVVGLLRKLRRRSDVTAIVAQDIDQVLATTADAPGPAPVVPAADESPLPTAVLPAAPPPSSPRPAPPSPAPPPTSAPAPSPPPPTQPPPPPPTPWWRRRAVLTAGVAGVVLVVVVIALLAGGDDPDDGLATGDEISDGNSDGGGGDEDTGESTVYDGVQVFATSAWTDTGIELAGGEKVIITAEGEIGDNPDKPDQRFDPGGAPREDPDEHPGDPYLEFPHAALGGQIGDGEVFAVGYGVTIEDAPAGRLYLGVNDGNVEDNSDQFDVDIEIFPA